jgi:hypothetical protein
MTFKTDWRTYLSCVGCAGGAVDLFVVDGTGAANTLTPYGGFPNSLTGSFRVGNKEWEYCSRRGRCNQENGECRRWLAIIVAGFVWSIGPPGPATLGAASPLACGGQSVVLTYCGVTCFFLGGGRPLRMLPGLLLLRRLQPARGQGGLWRRIGPHCHLPRDPTGVQWARPLQRLAPVLVHLCRGLDGRRLL